MVVNSEKKRVSVDVLQSTVIGPTRILNILKKTYTEPSINVK